MYRITLILLKISQTQQHGEGEKKHGRHKHGERVSGQCDLVALVTAKRQMESQDRRFGLAAIARTLQSDTGRQFGHNHLGLKYMLLPYCRSEP